MENKIINLLKLKENISMSFEEIERELNITKEELNIVLKKLEKDGTIYKNKNNKYSLLSRTSLKKGIVQMGKKKRPIVVIDGFGNFNLINKNSNVKNNSVVLVDINSIMGGAIVVKVLNSRKKTYIGQVVRKDDKLVIRSNNREDIILNEEYPEGVYVLVDSYTNKIKKIFDLDNDYKLVKREYTEITYSDAYLKELSKISKLKSSEIMKKAISNGTGDLRKNTVVTFSLNNNDLINIGFCCENNKLMIFTPDMTSVIKENGVIEKDAINKVKLSHFSETTPMFHQQISNDICLINPHVDKLVNSLIFTIKPGYSIIPYSFNKSVINSKARLTYKSVNDFFEKGIIPNEDKEISNMLKNLYKETYKIRNDILKNGFLMYSSEEVKFFLDNTSNSKGQIGDIIKVLMFLYNATKTNYMVQHNLPFIAKNYNKSVSFQKLYATFTLPNERLCDYINERIFNDSVKYGFEITISKWKKRVEELEKTLSNIEKSKENSSAKNEPDRVGLQSIVHQGVVITEVGIGYIKVLLPNNEYRNISVSRNKYILSENKLELINGNNGEIFAVGDLIDAFSNDRGELSLIRNSYGKEEKYEKKKKRQKIKKR